LTQQSPDYQRLRSDAPPPASEDIHLPGPSYLPIIVALSITAALVGLLVTPLIFVAGLVVTVVAVVVWARDARSDIAELPLDHG
jgi:hypothetical protein